MATNRNQATNVTKDMEDQLAPVLLPRTSCCQRRNTEGGETPGMLIAIDGTDFEVMERNQFKNDVYSYRE